MPDIRMPDGQVVRFPDTMSHEQISGLIASKYPREVGAAGAAKPFSERNTAGHLDFDGSNIPGYDPQTGMVAPSTVEDMALSGRTGLRNAAESTVGMPGDFRAMNARVADWFAGKLGAPEGPARENFSELVGDAALGPIHSLAAIGKRAFGIDTHVPTTADINEFTSQYVGDSYQPGTTAGEITKTAAELSPALLGPGGLVRRAATWLGATAGAEGGERAAKKLGFEDYAPYARFAGTVIGGGLPALFQGTTQGVKEAAKQLGVKSQDMTRFIKRMQQDGLSPDEINARLRDLGPDAMPMDVGANLRQEGQRIVAKGGEGRAMISDALNARDAGANVRIRGEVNANLGPAPVPSMVDAGLERTQRSLGPLYEKALENARAVNTEAIANDIDSMIANTRGAAQSKLQEVRKMLDVPGTDQLDPHPRAALATRQALDGMIGDTMDGNVKRVLGDFRKRLDAEIGTAVPGIKEIDAKYANLAQQREAFERGRSILDSGRNAPTPADVARDAGSSASTKFRLSQGARADIERIIGTNANDRVALQRIIKGDGDWNQQKLVSLFGQDKTDRIMSVLEREKVFAETSNRTIKNSATAERLPEDAGYGLGVTDAIKVGGPKAALYAGAMKGLESIVDRVRTNAANARDTNVSKLLTETDRNRLVTALIKANGGKPVNPQMVDGAIRMMLLLPGGTSALRAPVQQ